MLQYQKVLVRRSELSSVVKEVPVWEVPILEAIFQMGVEVQGELYVDRPAPDAQDEYERLSTKYRQSVEEDGSKGPTFTAIVYGQFNQGVMNLRRLIGEATVKEAPEGAEVKAAPKKRVKIGDLFE